MVISFTFLLGFSTPPVDVFPGSVIFHCAVIYFYILHYIEKKKSLKVLNDFICFLNKKLYVSKKIFLG